MPIPRVDGDETVHKHTAERIKREFIEPSHLEQSSHSEHEVGTCPDEPRHRMLCARVMVYLPQKREERREDADVPACEDKYVCPVFLCFDYYSVHQKQPRQKVDDGEKDI